MAVREVAAAFPPCGGFGCCERRALLLPPASTAVSAPPVRPQTLHPACPLLLPRGGVHTSSSDKTESDRQILRPAPVIFRPEQQQEGGVAGR